MIPPQMGRPVRRRVVGAGPDFDGGTPSAVNSGPDDFDGGTPTGGGSATNFDGGSP